MASDDTDDPEGSQAHDEVLWTAVGVEAGLGALAILLGATLGPDARELIPSLSAHAWPAVIGGLGLGVLATGPLLLLIAIIRRIKHPAIEELETLGDHPMIRTMLQLSYAELFVISCCAGVGEELLFRGWLFASLAGESTSLVTLDPDAAVRWWAWGGWLSDLGRWDDFGGPANWAQWWSSHGGWRLTVGLVLSSLAFGMFHPITRLYVALTAVIGLYFGMILVLTGNLLIPITAHALYDAAQLWSAKYETDHDPPLETN